VSTTTERGGGLRVAFVPKTKARPLVSTHHYAGGLHNAASCVGLFDGDELVSVAAFACPSSENVRTWPMGAAHKSAVTELHRLVMLPSDVWPKRRRNELSMFLVEALKTLHESRPELRVCLSFADTTEGHTGAIYRATNWLYLGKTRGKRLFYRDQTGRLRHPRQNGVNVSKAEASRMGWVEEVRLEKHKFAFVFGDARKRRETIRLMSIERTKREVAARVVRVSGGST